MITKISKITSLSLCNKDSYPCAIVICILSMQYQKIQDKYIIRIDKGELVHATLHQFCNEHDIKNALISAIGAVEFVRCGIYDLTARAYNFEEYEQIVEVVSYTGNIAPNVDGLFVHAHGTFSDHGNSVFGGHVDEMRVGVVLEVTLEPLPSQMTRTYDEQTGLYLLNLPNKSIK